jgi:hypothetical protein
MAGGFPKGVGDEDRAVAGGGTRALLRLALILIEYLVNAGSCDPALTCVYYAERVCCVTPNGFGLVISNIPVLSFRTYPSCHSERAYLVILNALILSF